MTRFFHPGAWVLILCLLPILSSAQLKTAAQLELLTKHKTGDNYQILPVGERGVVVVFRNEKPHGPKRKRLYEFTLLDTALQVVWKSEVEVLYREERLELLVSENHFHLLLVKDRNSYHFVKVSLTNGEVTEAVFEEYKLLQVTHFEASDNMWFLGGSLKDRPIGIGIPSDLPKGTITTIKAHTILPGINNEKTSLIHTATSDKAGIFTAIVAGDYGSEKRKAFINIYDLGGKLLFNTAIEREGFYELLTFRPILISREEQIIIGSYAVRGEKYAQGFYFMKFVNGKRTLSRFYDSGFLKNFFMDYTEKRRGRLLTKVKNKREDGKIKRIRYRILLHKPRLEDDQIHVTGEVYQVASKVSRDGTVLESEYYGMPPGMAMRQFLEDGQKVGDSFMPSFLGLDETSFKYEYPTEIEYEKLVAFGIDTEGRLLWDNIYEYDPSEQKREDMPLQAMAAVPSQDSLVMVQGNDDKVFYRISDYKAYDDSVRALPAYQLYNEDKVTKFTAGGISYWYMNNAIQCGLITINNPMLDDRNRDVFFIKRLEYVPHMDDD